MRDRGTGADRRVVITRITPNGLERVNALDRPIERLHREQLSKLTDDEIQILNDLFEKLDLK
jgi:DNA-binding MarR family transcriptional regulator